MPRYSLWRDSELRPLRCSFIHLNPVPWGVEIVFHSSEINLTFLQLALNATTLQRDAGIAGSVRRAYMPTVTAVGL